MANVPLAAISPSAPTMPAMPAAQSAPTLGKVSQVLTPVDSQVAAVPLYKTLKGNASTIGRFRCVLVSFFKDSQRNP